MYNFDVLFYNNDKFVSIEKANLNEDPQCFKSVVTAVSQGNFCLRTIVRDHLEFCDTIFPKGVDIPGHI